MTVSNQVSSVTFTGNGAASVFPYTFLIPDEDYAVVIHLADDGTRTVLADTEYSITGIGDAAGGEVTYTPGGVTTALPSGEYLVLNRELDYIQQLNLTNNAAYLAENLEAQLDYITFVLQQLKTESDRSLKTVEGFSFGEPMPTPADLAERSLAFDASGNPIVGPTVAAIEQAGTDASEAAASAAAAAASESNAASSASSAASSAATAEAHKDAAATSATAAASSEADAETAQTAAETAQTAAEAAQTAAETAESNASSSETAAAASASTASTKASEASTSATAAAGSASAAATSASNAATSETNAAASEGLAEKWAEENEDVEVTTGKYSAKHWAAKAQNFATGDAVNIGVTPSGDISSTNVQDALEELDSEKAPASHNHDDRYYTETEVDSLLSGKANSSHTHTIANVTGLQTALDGKAATSHNHDNRYYTEAEVDALIASAGQSPDYQVFTASGTWNKPAGIDGNSLVLIQLVGGGGGGGRLYDNQTVYGGSGGNYYERVMRASELPSSVSVTVGSGGAGRSSTGSGSAGGDTSFGSYAVARGGKGGVFNDTVYPNDDDHTTRWTGGLGGMYSSGDPTDGDNSYQGAGGGAGYGDPQYNAPGSCLYGFAGSGGNGGRYSGNNGSDGVAPGGGGGASRRSTSGDGARGEARITVLG